MRATLLCLGLAGCMTYGRTMGAATLEPGQVEFTWVGALRGDESGSGLPLPGGGGVELRVGLRDDLDVGFQSYLLGAGMDLRQRVLHRGSWHLAVAPGLGAVAQPNLLNASELLLLQTRIPLLIQYDLNDWANLSGGTWMMSRQYVAFGRGGALWRFEPRAGAGVRFEVRRGLFVLGVGLDAMTNPVGRKLLGVAALDLKIRTRTRERANARHRRLGRPPKWPALEE